MKRSMRVILIAALCMLALSMLPGAHNSARAASAESMMSNMLAAGHVPSGKRQAVSKIGAMLLNEGYEPAFVAGICANVIKEGSFGVFESSAYKDLSKKPSYLIYMDNNYNYRNTYSGRYIYNGFSLSSVKALLLELQSGGWQGAFGLGSVQWTNNRTLTLVNTYINYAGGSDTITYDQCVQAEMQMIVDELKGSNRAVVINWRNSNGNRYAPDAAYNAGWRVCTEYERPSNASVKAVERAELARQLYIDMRLETEPPVISNVQIVDLTKDGYTVVCNVSDNMGISRVMFPTWYTGQSGDEIKWLTGSISGNTASCHISVSDYGGVTGVDYNTHIYAYDWFENSAKAETSAKVPLFYAEMLDPVVFDAAYYSSRYEDLAAAYGDDVTGLQNHWVRYGVEEGRVASPLFDVNYYQQANPDVIQVFGESRAEAVRHFIRYGIPEGRDPSPDFRLELYRDNYYDLQNAFGDDNYQYYLHYIRFGLEEGRIADRRIAVTLDPAGGTVSPTEMTVTGFGPYGTLPEPAKAQALFAGWYTQAEGGELITAESEVDYKVVQTLYAHWYAPVELIAHPPEGDFPAGHQFTKDDLFVEVLFENGDVVEVSDYDLIQSGTRLTITYGPLTSVIEAEAMPEPDFILPAGTTAIEEDAFAGIGATVVQVPEGCASIGKRAFADCPNLICVIIPDLSAVDIAEDALEGTNAVFIEP